MKQRYVRYLLFLPLSLMCIYAQAQEPVNTQTDTTLIKNYKPVIPEYRGVLGDSAVIPKPRQEQQTRYLEGSYPYPPKPRNKWEIGAHGGGWIISGDVPSRGGWGAGLQVRKSIGYAFSVQGHYMHGTTFGLGWQSNTGLANNPVLSGKKYPNINYLGKKFFMNYKTVGNEASLGMLLTLNNIGFHSKAIDRKVTM